MEENYEQDYGVDPNVLQAHLAAQQKNDPSFLRFTLDPEAELEAMKYDLIGYTENDDGKFIKDPKKIQQINEEGANAIMTYIRPRITKIFSLSNFDDEDVNSRCLVFVNGLTYYMCRHREDFEIMSWPTVNNIIDLFDDLYFATVSKAVLGWEGDGIRKTHSTYETKNVSVNNNQKNNMMRPRNSIWGG